METQQIQAQQQEQQVTEIREETSMKNNQYKEELSFKEERICHVKNSLCVICVIYALFFLIAMLVL